MKLGRPTTFDPMLAKEICQRLADGESLMQICRDDHMPNDSTVRTWARDDREGFYADYACARDLWIDRKAEDILELAADRSRDANCRRVELDTIKWYLSKLAPKRYGDRLELAGSVDTSKGWAEVLRERRAKRAERDKP